MREKKPFTQRPARFTTDGTRPGAAQHGVARTLSRMGYCSRSEAVRLVEAGRVSLNGAIVRDPDARADAERDDIEVDGTRARARTRVCIAVNKPRGLLVTASDEHGRDTVYALLRDADLPWLAPVGRLDKASEGLLLMSNDPAWAALVTDPTGHVAKTYRVQVRGVPDAAVLQRLRGGVLDHGEMLSAVALRTIGGGAKNTWLEIVLAEGRNRQIRRMLAACSYGVLRLLRVAIGPLQLGDLPKGAWRLLSDAEVQSVMPAAARVGRHPGALRSALPHRPPRSR